MKELVCVLLLSALLPAAAKTIYVSVDGPADDHEYLYDDYSGQWFYYEQYWYDEGGGSGWMDTRAVYIDGEPGGSWENAYSSIGSACDRAESGDTVLVGPGTYEPFEEYYDKGITIRSVAGAEHTVVDAKNDDYGPFVSLGATDRIVGFTVQNSLGGGIDGGYADACIIRDCGSIGESWSGNSGTFVQRYCFSSGA